MAVSAGEREADVEAAIPSLKQAGIHGFLVGGFLGRIADDGDIRFRELDWAGSFGGDDDLISAGSNRADNGLAVLPSHGEIFRGLNTGDRGPVDGHFAGEFGLDDQSFAVGLDDGSGETVAVLKGDLIGKKVEREEGQHYR